MLPPTCTKGAHTRVQLMRQMDAATAQAHTQSLQKVRRRHTPPHHCTAGVTPTFKSNSHAMGNVPMTDDEGWRDGARTQRRLERTCTGHFGGFANLARTVTERLLSEALDTPTAPVADNVTLAYPAHIWTGACKAGPEYYGAVRSMRTQLVHIIQCIEHADGHGSALHRAVKHAAMDMYHRDDNAVALRRLVACQMPEPDWYEESGSRALRTQLDKRLSQM